MEMVLINEQVLFATISSKTKLKWDAIYYSYHEQKLDQITHFSKWNRKYKKGQRKTKLRK